jgi:hypothetical protein
MNTSRFALLAGGVALATGTVVLLAGASPAPGGEVPLDFAKIYWEYNSSAEDLGVHVSLDGEDWKELSIENPDGRVLFDVKGHGPYKTFGMTELFFEGAEPSLAEVPLDELLDAFPEGIYEFSGKDVDGEAIEGEDEFTHAIPAGPAVSAQVAGSDFLRISWSPVTSPPPGFPDADIEIVAWQVLVDSFDVILPAEVFSLTISPEFVATLEPGEHQFEVLAIEASGNQTITEGSFVK